MIINSIEFIEDFVAEECPDKTNDPPLVGLKFRLSTDTDANLSDQEITRAISDTDEKIMVCERMINSWDEFEKQTVYTEYEDYENEISSMLSYYLSKKLYLEESRAQRLGQVVRQMPNNINTIIAVYNDCRQYLNNFKIAVGRDKYTREKYWHGITIGRSQEEAENYKRDLFKHHESCTENKHKKYINAILSELNGELLHKLHMELYFKDGYRGVLLKIQTRTQKEYYIIIYCARDSYEDSYHLFLSYNTKYILLDKDNF